MIIKSRKKDVDGIEIQKSEEMKSNMKVCGKQTSKQLQKKEEIK